MLAIWKDFRLTATTRIDAFEVILPRVIVLSYNPNIAPLLQPYLASSGSESPVQFAGWYCPVYLRASLRTSISNFEFEKFVARPGHTTA